jgi:hypothetical protein
MFSTPDAAVCILDEISWVTALCSSIAVAAPVTKLCTDPMAVLMAASGERTRRRRP